jgi:hypothetical protein
VRRAPRTWCAISAVSTGGSFHRDVSQFELARASPATHPLHNVSTDQVEMGGLALNAVERGIVANGDQHLSARNRVPSTTWLKGQSKNSIPAEVTNNTPEIEHSCCVCIRPTQHEPYWSSETRLVESSHRGLSIVMRFEFGGWDVADRSRRTLNESTHSSVANSTASSERHGPSAESIPSSRARSPRRCRTHRHGCPPTAIAASGSVYRIERYCRVRRSE